MSQLPPKKSISDSKTRLKLRIIKRTLQIPEDKPSSLNDKNRGDNNKKVLPIARPFSEYKPKYNFRD
jgi:hypothetical protein